MTQLFLRTTDKDGKAYGGFQWPLEVGAIVTAPDWKPTTKCGNGLHGLLNGEGEAGHLSLEESAIWWIVEAENAIDLCGKHKFQSCRVVAFGKREDITQQMRRMTGGAVHGLIESGGYRATLTGGDYAKLTGGNEATLTGGDYATLTGGYEATLTGGDRAKLTGGDGATLTGGDLAKLTGGHRAKLTGGYRAKLTGGDLATLTGGYEATLTGGDRAKLTGGEYATLTGGDYATLTGGDRSTLTGGEVATLTGGDRSTLIFLRWKEGRRRVLTAYVGEDGIEPGKPYRANDDHTKVVPA